MKDRNLFGSVSSCAQEFPLFKPASTHRRKCQHHHSSTRGQKFAYAYIRTTIRSGLEFQPSVQNTSSRSNILLPLQRELQQYNSKQLRDRTNETLTMSLTWKYRRPSGVKMWVKSTVSRMNDGGTKRCRRWGRWSTSYSNDDLSTYAEDQHTKEGTGFEWSRSTDEWLKRERDAFLKTGSTLEGDDVPPATGSGWGRRLGSSAEWSATGAGRSYTSNFDFFPLLLRHIAVRGHDRDLCHWPLWLTVVWTLVWSSVVGGERYSQTDLL